MLEGGDLGERVARQMRLLAIRVEADFDQLVGDPLFG